MSQAGKCTKCGGIVPPDATTMGLCPRCLISGVRERRSAVRPPAHGNHPNRQLPDPHDLAAAFPEIELLGVLGQGGSGAVYKARHRTMDGFVALKVLRVTPLDEPATIERFLGEARILEGLIHPHIVRAHGSGSTGNYLYVILEMVEGPSLRQVLSHGPLPPRIALKIGVQLCNGLGFAHSRGIIHRDIKPENILLHPGSVPASQKLSGFFEGDGRARLADFGLAREFDAMDMQLSLTLPHHRVGTLDYMAPEIRSTRGRSDARGDVYGVGIVLYEMLTGQLPLGVFPPTHELCDTDEQVDAIISRCLQSTPENRYSDGWEVRGDLARILARMPVGTGDVAGPVEKRTSAGLGRLFGR
jgi:eukaryotic-like serine/threonine-protein kinase